METYVNKTYISDMGLCRKIDDVNQNNIYGVMPYVAPEVLRRKPSTQAADIYSFDMTMYFVTTGRQTFDNCAHDYYLAKHITHLQAIYTSQLFNPFTENLPEYIDNSECLDCTIP
ncbi:hypothetical protein RclHR1_01430007 [Rhizophagus clarus]|nr:hypothetical protein RclHR1_01430007 [Rhizophagus clarus]